VHDERGDLVGFAKVTRDITERLRLVQQQSHFLAVTAHELRAPVGVLAESAALLRGHGGELAEHERAALLDGMVSSGGRLGRLVDDLLAASQVPTGGFTIRSRRLRVVDELTDLVGGVARTHEVDVRVAPLPDVVVLADPDRVTQMVENLFLNALRHGAEPVAVAGEVVGDVLELAVRDAGGGVTAEFRPRLFERFATTSEDGTGLGLYIVRELARAQDGDAWHREADGSFVLGLPLAPESQPESQPRAL